jgi:outer membrane usher protein FimD/PapC
MAMDSDMLNNAQHHRIPTFTIIAATAASLSVQQNKYEIYNYSETT